MYCTSEDRVLFWVLLKGRMVFRVLGVTARLARMSMVFISLFF